MVRFQGERLQVIMQRMGWEEGMALDNPMMSRTIESAQKRVEAMHFESRKHVTEYDDVMNKQRQVIYNLRSRILRNERIREEAFDIIDDIFESAVTAVCDEKIKPIEWDLSKLVEKFAYITGREFSFPENMQLDHQEIFDALRHSARAIYTTHAEEQSAKLVGLKEIGVSPQLNRGFVGEGAPVGFELIEQDAMLEAVDYFWRHHLQEMDYLREGIGLRGYADDSRFAGRTISSVFWGGGTPSLLSPDAIATVHSEARRLFGIDSGAEVTLEANPSEPSKARYAGYRAAGVNRVSFGVQSFSPKRLQLLGRDHSDDDARRAVHLCVEAGISNVSLDIIFGVAEQTLADLEFDLEVASSLPIAHISTYALTIEPGTPFFQRQERGLLTIPPDDLVATMLEFIPAYLSAKGFSRYEISNYARGDRRSRHNEAYWTGLDYLGIGAGAHSYVTRYEKERRVGGSRWSTLALPASYMKAAGTPTSVSWREELSPESSQFEFFYLGLRRIGGVSLDDFERLFGRSADSIYGEALRELSDEGFIHVDGSRVALTQTGIALADSVYERFLR